MLIFDVAKATNAHERECIHIDFFKVLMSRVNIEINFRLKGFPAVETVSFVKSTPVVVHRRRENRKLGQ